VPPNKRPLILQGHELAIWQYDGAMEDSYQSETGTSIVDSKNKVDSLLATINSVSTKRKTESPEQAGKHVSFF
jgi:hypothetical protein